ncbi:MAG: PspC domain-containing protein [Burkholderiaceae bacterium]|nr:PspC domain-containing protein [Burkholderiaceae bacterium]
MGLADDLERVAGLHRSGALNDAEYGQAKAKLLRDARPAGEGARRAVDKLRRSIDDRWIGGVCGGIGAATATESWIWRLLFCVGLFAGGVTGLLYLLMWLLVPSMADDLL